MGRLTPAVTSLELIVAAIVLLGAFSILYLHDRDVRAETKPDRIEVTSEASITVHTQGQTWNCFREDSTVGLEKL